MKNIAIDSKKLDKRVREFWGISNITQKTYFAVPPIKPTSLNWYGFIERVNECVKSPTWRDIKGFVEFYCQDRKVESELYIKLYDWLEKEGYSSVFKTSTMNDYYNQAGSEKNHPTYIYNKIFEYLSLNGQINEDAEPKIWKLDEDGLNFWAKYD